MKSAVSSKDKQKSALPIEPATYIVSLGYMIQIKAVHCPFGQFYFLAIMSVGYS